MTAITGSSSSLKEKIWQFVPKTREGMAVTASAVAGLVITSLFSVDAGYDAYDSCMDKFGSMCVVSASIRGVCTATVGIIITSVVIVSGKFVMNLVSDSHNERDIEIIQV